MPTPNARRVHPQHERDATAAAADATWEHAPEQPPHVEGLRVAGVGGGVGVGVALATSRLLAAPLYGVAPTDPVTLGLATIALLLVCAAAVLVPARRAARADPARVRRTK